MKTIIVGGGAAGAAAACLLGPDALLIERETAAHDKICGEFLSWEAQEYLSRLGLDLTALGAVPIDRVRLVYRGQVAEAPLPFQGLGLTRRALDEALLQHAAARGATVLRGHAVRGFADGVLEVAGQGRLPAPRLFLATGKHDLRGLRREPDQPPPEWVGLKMYLTITPAQQAELAGHVEIMMFQGGYAGLQMVEGNRANFCLLLDRTRFQHAGRTWPGVAQMLSQDCLHIARRLAGSVPLLSQPISIFRVPYGFIHRPRLSDPVGLFRLGDQMGVIPSFCGDGVSIALHSAFLASRSPGSTTYHNQMGREAGRPIKRARRLFAVGQRYPWLTVQAVQHWPSALRWISRLTRLSYAVVDAPL